MPVRIMLLLALQVVLIECFGTRYRGQQGAALDTFLSNRSLSSTSRQIQTT